MHTVQPVMITLPDGAERELRFTVGASKRIHEALGMDYGEALRLQGDGALPAILFALMHDADGNPPTVSVKWLEENLPADASYEIMAAVASARSQGAVSKKELEDLMIMAARKVAQNGGNPTGSTSGDSAVKSSASVIEISGGDTSNAKSPPESDGISVSSEPIESSAAQ